MNFYLANKMLEIDPEKFPSAKFATLQQNAQKALRRSLQTFLYFILSFGFFLINLASFTAAKLFYSSFVLIENTILLLWGPIALIVIRLLIMFLVQLILIVPFDKFQGNLWDSYKTIETHLDYNKGIEN